MATTRLHSLWKSTKNVLTKAQAEIKKDKGNCPSIDAALKGFDAGFGPRMDKVGDAFKAGKDQEVKAQATKALAIAAEYRKLTEAVKFECRIEVKRMMDSIVQDLTDLANKGTTSTVKLYI
jgi:hypothetical protein